MPRWWLAVCAMLLGLATQGWSQLRAPAPKRTGQIVNYYPILSRVHTPELNPQTKADTLFGLYQSVGPWPGDSARYNALLDLSARFAPVLQSTNFSVPRDFEQILSLSQGDTILTCPATIRLSRDVWRLDRPSPELVDLASHPVYLKPPPVGPCAGEVPQGGKPQPGSLPVEGLEEVRRLLNRYDPFRLSQPGARRDRDTVLYWNFPGSNPDQWRKFYRKLAGKPGLASRVYVHPFLFGHQSESGKPKGWELVLQYWFFYPFNDGVNDHEGDWEHINVSLSTLERLITGRRYERLLDSVDVRRILQTDRPFPLDSVAISAVDYYFHHWVVTVDYKPEYDSTFVHDTVLYDWDFQERFGAQRVLPRPGGKPDATVRIVNPDPSGWDDPRRKNPALQNRPVVFIGGANKSVLQLFTTAGQDNKNTHGSYPFPGLWMGVGAKATERVFGRRAAAYKPQDPPEAGKGTTVFPARPDLILLPDWEGLYSYLKDPQTPDWFVREWFWLVLPIRWGYPATQSIGSGIIADYDFGNVSPVGPAHNDGWNRVGSGPNFDRFLVYPDFRPFRRVTHDFITPQSWFLTIATISGTMLPPFNAFGTYVVSYAKLFPKSDRTIYQNSLPPRDVFEFALGTSVSSSGHGFRLPLRPAEVSLAAGALGRSEVRSRAVRLGSHPRGIGFVTHLSPGLATESLLLRTDGTLRDTLVGADGISLGTIERNVVAIEVLGAFRLTPQFNLPLGLEPLARLGYGWSWYGVNQAEVFDQTGASIQTFSARRPPGSRFPLGFLPNTALFGLGAQVGAAYGFVRPEVRVSYNLFTTKGVPGHSEVVAELGFNF